jgi:RNA polymerase sigma factor (sigma-70 family)
MSGSARAREKVLPDRPFRENYFFDRLQPLIRRNRCAGVQEIQVYQGAPTVIPGPLAHALRQIRFLNGENNTEGTSDRRLLAQFALSRDEAAFAALVRRHGPMVLGVCQRTLRHQQDAEDVFQATFLVLARQAGTIRTREALGGWLYRVAYRLALRARTEIMRRQRHERQSKPLMAAANPPAEATWRELPGVVDEELSRLPAASRAVLVLCCLEGKTQKEAARQLGWPPGSMSWRLGRARDLLRKRLARRGWTVPAGLIGPAFVEEATAAVPAELASQTVQAAVAFAGGTVPTGGAAAAALAKAFLRGLFLVHLKLVAVAMALVVGLTVAGVGIAVWTDCPPETAKNQGPKPAASSVRPPGPLADQQIRTDLFGDPLPAGVLTRVGSGRMRDGWLTSAVVFSPDGKSLATCSHHAVCIWDVTTGKHKQRVQLSQGQQFEAPLAFSADSTSLTLLRRGEATTFGRIIDVASGAPRQELKLGGIPEVAAAALSPDGSAIAMARADATVRLYDSTGNEKARVPLGVPPPGLRPRWHLALSRDGSTFAFSDETGTIRVYSTATGRQTSALQVQGKTFTTMVFSPDGRWLVAIPNPGSGDDGVVIWELATGKESFRFWGRGFGYCAAFSPDGKWLATGVGDRDLAILDVVTGKEVRRCRLGDSADHAAFSPDGKLVAVATGNGEITLWDVVTGRRMPASADPIVFVRDLRFAQGGKSLVGTTDVIREWEVATGRELRHYADVPRSPPWQIVLSPDGTLSATFDDKAIHLWDAQSGRKVRELHRPGCAPLGLVFAADGRRLYAGAKDHTIRIWDVASGRDLAPLTPTESPVADLAVSPDGRWLAFNDTNVHIAQDGPVRLWDLSAGREVRRLQMKGQRVVQYTFSPDGRFLAALFGVVGRVAAERSGVHVWEVATGKEWPTVQQPRDDVTCLAFTADGGTLAIGGADGTLRLWERCSGKERSRFAGHQEFVASVAFSPDGRYLAASSLDAPVYIRDLSEIIGTREEVSTVQLERAWADLGDADAEKAYRTIWTLRAAPEKGATLLWDRLRPPAVPDPGRLNALLHNLDSERFATRDQAMKELEGLGELVQTALHKALARQASAEVHRRVEQLLERIQANLLRSLRAVEALENMGTPKAREILRELAKGSPDARLTQEAKSSFDRLARRSR